MAKTTWTAAGIACLTVAALVGAAGCRDHMPHSATWPAGGDVVPSHPEPPEGGYYTNWDPYAVTLEVMPVKDVNPVRTQHVVVATVKDREGEPLPNRRVEWVVAEGSVGDIVEVDESGWRASRGWKQTNKYAVSHTNNGAHVLDRGNDDPADDIHLTRGQTWIVVTSPVEGTTHLIAYAPGIYDWNKHKVFAEKHWYDVKWEWPPAATNRIGTSHQFVTKVTKYSDGTPLVGYQVTYAIVDGPAAKLAPGGKQTAEVTTDANGLAAVTLTQDKPAEGTNTIKIDVVRPGNDKCCIPPVHIATGHTRKTWLGPRIGIAKDAPATAVVGETFRYDIAVTNPGRVSAEKVVVTDALPDGIAYVSSTPEATVKGRNLSWSLGSLAAGGRKAIAVTVKGTKTGTFKNCADVKAADGLSARDCAETRLTQARLALEKTGPEQVLICLPIPYKIVVRNTGDAAATNVKISDKLPEGLTWKGEKQVSADVGTLAAGEAKQLDFVARASKTGTYVNKATATADGGLTAQASAKTVVKQPVLVITKSGPKKRFKGLPVTYEITVTNKGDAAAQDTVLTDTLPTNATFVKAGEGGTHAGGKVTWPLGDLAVGASRKVSVTLRADRIGTLHNRVSATAVCASADAEASTVVSGIPAILLECVDQADPIEVGHNETYTITVTNQGSAEGTNVVITCTLPAEQTFVSADGPTKDSVKGKVVTFAALKSLAPKARATYRVVAKGNKAGDVRFKVSLNSDQMTSPATETESTHIYE